MEDINERSTVSRERAAWSTWRAGCGKTASPVRRAGSGSEYTPQWTENSGRKTMSTPNPSDTAPLSAPTFSWILRFSDVRSKFGHKYFLSYIADIVRCGQFFSFYLPQKFNNSMKKLKAHFVTLIFMAPAIAMKNSLIRASVALLCAVMLVFFGSNAYSSDNSYDIQCNYTCSFMGCGGGHLPCRGAGVRCCHTGDLPCTSNDTWGVLCMEGIFTWWK